MIPDAITFTLISIIQNEFQVLMIDPLEILKQYWGYHSFRSLQEDIIHSVLSGTDTLAVMPTGAGKSLCFQVPSMAKEGLCLVVSPLIALMKDQVSNLKKKGIPALSVDSAMGYSAVKKTLQNAAYGNFKFLYISPERLQTDLFRDYLPLLKVNVIAVDEAHCISQWGYDFRPSYRYIAAIREYFPAVPVLALTASATPEVQKDIAEKLLFNKNQRSFQPSFERPNLSYSAFRVISKQAKLLDILNKVSGSGLVYCKTRRRTREIAGVLNANGISAGYYHAGLPGGERDKKQEDWISNETRIMVCTNAFGMGIDKPDVRTVIHADVPDALENYYQEAGRAGRDGQKSYAVLLYSETEFNDLKKQSALRFPSTEMIRKVYGALCNFLQLPAGSGEGISYEIDLSTFAKNFKLDPYIINSVLKILEQEELMIYSEQFFSPATVGFTTDRHRLDVFEKSDRQYHQVIEALLRSYDGIFDVPSVINETRLAKQIAVNKERVRQWLVELSGLGIIEYTPPREKPRIYFLQNRVKAADLFINQKSILQRKEAYEKRLAVMIGFCTNNNSCRSQVIGSYFNDHKLEPCGICDNCLSIQKRNHSTGKKDKDAGTKTT